jgi:hypothetical protein
MLEWTARSTLQQVGREHRDVKERSCVGWRVKKKKKTIGEKVERGKAGYREQPRRALKNEEERRLG